MPTTLTFENSALCLWNVTIFIYVIGACLVIKYLLLVHSGLIALKSDKMSEGPSLWSSGQSFWLQIQRSRVRFSALPDFLRSSGSGTGSTQPREDN
jgi:hypothetical protein